MLKKKKKKKDQNKFMVMMNFDVGLEEHLVNAERRGEDAVGK